MGLMDFHVTECKKFIDLASALQLIFRKPQLVKFAVVLWMTINIIKISLPFPALYLCGAGSSPYTST